jgi:hypothetical protein
MKEVLGRWVRFGLSMYLAKGVIERVGKPNPLYMWGSHQISGYPLQRFRGFPERVSHKGGIGQVGKI